MKYSTPKLVNISVSMSIKCQKQHARVECADLFRSPTCAIIYYYHQLPVQDRYIHNCSSCIQDEHQNGSHCAVVTMDTYLTEVLQVLVLNIITTTDYKHDRLQNVQERKRTGLHNSHVERKWEHETTVPKNPTPAEKWKKNEKNQRSVFIWV